jgi:hypothetical protein
MPHSTKASHWPTLHKSSSTVSHLVHTLCVHNIVRHQDRHAMQQHELPAASPNSNNTLPMPPFPCLMTSPKRRNPKNTPAVNRAVRNQSNMTTPCQLPRLQQ